MPDYMILQELKKLKVCDAVAQTGMLVESEICLFSEFCIFVFAPKKTNYESIQQTARSIAEQAHVLAYDPNYMSPFAQFACDNGLNVRGRCLLESCKNQEVFGKHRPNRTMLCSLFRWKAR